MDYSLYRFILRFLMPLFFVSLGVVAQTENKQLLNVSVGYGLSAPFEETSIDINGTGFYAQGEYVIKYKKWFDYRPYLGVIFTNTDASRFGSYEVSSNAVMLGSKVRFSAPIPWVAPFIEIGMGGSIGTFKTILPNKSLKQSGFLIHIPFSLGLAIGKNRNYEVEFTYYFHEAVRQFNGALAFGFTMPIRKKSK